MYSYTCNNIYARLFCNVINLAEAVFRKTLLMEYILFLCLNMYKFITTD